MEVADTGRGFGPVETGTASMGLEIVTAFATRHGGRVVVGSGESGGATVAIDLPAVTL